MRHAFIREHEAVKICGVVSQDLLAVYKSAGEDGPPVAAVGENFFCTEISLFSCKTFCVAENGFQSSGL